MLACVKGSSPIIVELIANGDRRGMILLWQPESATVGMVTDEGFDALRECPSSC